MTCWNINTKIVVEMQKSGKTYIGKVKDMPVQLMEEWAKFKYGERRIKKAIEEAEEVFLTALFENAIEHQEQKRKFT
jgi:predicted alpha/beta hydrolase